MSILGHMLACEKAHRLGLAPLTITEWELMHHDDFLEGAVIDRLAREIAEFYCIPEQQVWAELVCLPEELRSLARLMDGWVVIAGYVTERLNTEGPPLKISLH